MASVTLPALLKLPKKRRLEIAQRLWASVADDSMQVSPEHKKLLDERFAGYRSGKLKTITHAELMRRLRSREK